MESAFRRDDPDSRDAEATHRRHDEFISSSDSRRLDHEKGRTSERGPVKGHDANEEGEKSVYVCGYARARARDEEVGTRRGNICRVQQSRTPAVW